MFNTILGSLVPIEQLYLPLFTSSWARQEPAKSRQDSSSHFENMVRAQHVECQHYHLINIYI